MKYWRALCIENLEGFIFLEGHVLLSGCNGNTAHPIYKYLKSKLGGILGSRIKWNFTKFLIDAKGRPIKRFAPITKPEDLEKDIVKLLEKWV